MAALPDLVLVPVMSIRDLEQVILQIAVTNKYRQEDNLARDSFSSRINAYSFFPNEYLLSLSDSW